MDTWLRLLDTWLRLLVEGLWRPPLLYGAVGASVLAGVEQLRRRVAAGWPRIEGGLLVVTVITALGFQDILSRLVLVTAVGVAWLAAQRLDEAGDATSADLEPWLLVITAGGLFGVLPDTEHALLLLGASSVTAVVTATGRMGFDVRSTAAVVVSVVWVVAVDAHRATAVVGGLGCLAMLVVLPVVSRAVRGGARPEGVWRSAALVVTHILAVGAASRLGGVQDQLVVAVGASLVGLAGSVVGALLSLPSRGSAGMR